MFYVAISFNIEEVSKSFLIFIVSKIVIRIADCYNLRQRMMKGVQTWGRVIHLMQKSNLNSMEKLTIIIN
ncbi:hypothetical protein GCM10007111_04690 [Virgibacillus kapii]|uniref:Transposase DDE domain-containing protein n=1 Tax=Virgibacillus kapii TaxID=1638645 RepID=A0ABQ2D5E2_9BACI|nr:hypothetical protein GCM10007111_04690 [Virgibacillus kapii]